MSAHQPNANLEFVYVGFAGKINNSLCTRPIDSDRLLHKDVQPTTDCILKVGGPKCCWRCKYCDVAWPQCVECLLESIKPHKHAIVRHINLIRKLSAQNSSHHLGPSLSNICKCSEFEWGFDHTKCVCSSAAPAATTSNQGNVD